jgi:protein-disulfide isomerase
VQLKLNRVSAVEMSLVSIALFASAVFAAATVRNVREADVVRKAKAGELMAASPDSVLRHSDLVGGTSKAPYRLVEFADYQCPPCRAAQAELVGALAKFGPSLAIYHRHLPLSAVHPFAEPAATAAEAARGQGKFIEMHDLLFSGELDEAHLGTYARSLGLDLRRFAKDRRSALTAVRNDVRETKLLGLTGTPSFVLVTPDGQVLKLQALSDLDSFLE